MALTYDDVTSKTNRFIVPRLVDNVYKASPVFTRLRTQNAERFEGGISINHPIMYAELRGGAFTRGGTLESKVPCLFVFRARRTNRVNSEKALGRVTLTQAAAGIGSAEGATTRGMSPNNNFPHERPTGNGRYSLSSAVSQAA